MVPATASQPGKGSLWRGSRTNFRSSGSRITSRRHPWLELRFTSVPASLGQIFMGRKPPFRGLRRNLRSQAKRFGGNRMERAIVLLSGGVDSAVALWWAKRKGWDIRPLPFGYFGRPKRENDAVRALSSRAEPASVRHVALPLLQQGV